MAGWGGGLGRAGGRERPARAAEEGASSVRGPLRAGHRCLRPLASFLWAFVLPACEFLSVHFTEIPQFFSSGHVSAPYPLGLFAWNSFWGFHSVRPSVALGYFLCFSLLHSEICLLVPCLLLHLCLVCSGTPHCVLI